MPLVPFNSVGGYSTGITGTAVIDANGNITGVGATFSGLARFNAGISAAGATLSGTVNMLNGFTAGSGTTFLQFVPLPSASNGGLFLRDGIFQIGGTQLLQGNGAFNYSPNTERFGLYGYQVINSSYNYQAGRPPLILNAAPTQSTPILAAYKQTSDGQQITGSFTTTNMVAGIDNNGALFSYSGISAAGGITFNSNVTINSANTLIASTIQSEVGKNQLDIANTSNSRVAIGDYDGTANSTYIFLRDVTSILDISNPYGLINIGDPFGIVTGYIISYEAAAGELNGNGSSIVNFASGSFNEIVSNVGFYETANLIKVTNNARSWFL